MTKELLGYVAVVAILLILWISVVRNSFVQYRCRKVLRAIDEQSKKEITKGHNWYWVNYYIRFHSVSYAKAVLMFWKPTTYFYNIEEILK